MGWDVLMMFECAACAAVVAAAAGFALLAMALSREVIPALSEEDRDTLAVW